MNADGFWKWVARINSLWALVIKISAAIATIGGLGIMACFAWLSGWHLIPALFVSIAVGIITGAMTLGLSLGVYALFQKRRQPRTVVEKHRAREHWRTRIDDLVKSAPKMDSGIFSNSSGFRMIPVLMSAINDHVQSIPESERNKTSGQKWQEHVIEAFNNLLVDPTEKRNEFVEMTCDICANGKVEKAIRRGVQFLLDMKDTIREADLR